MFKKKSIFTLCATALLATTTSVSAFAATTTYNDDPNAPTNSIAAVDSNKNVVKTKGVISGSTGSQTADAQGKSDANITITSGYLTLDAVPDLGFGTVGKNTKSNGKVNQSLVNNDSAINDDGNNQGRLAVTDSRTGSNSGYTLNAKLDSFTNLSGSSTPQNDWTLALNKPSNDQNLNKAPYNFNTPQITSSGTDNKPVLTSTQSSSGTTQAYYNKPENATLSFDNNNVAPGRYAAVITWTLAPNTDPANQQSN